MLALRDYQTALIADARAALRQHRRVLLVLPTGAGKTVVAAFMALASDAKGVPSCFVVHRQELVEQTSKAFAALGIRHGIIAPGHSPTADRVQVGMVQTIARRLDRLPRPKLVFLDEAHHAVAGTWRAIVEAWDGAAVVGLTASPERRDGKGLRDVFDDMVQGPTVADLMSGGWLAPYRLYAPPSQVDLSRVKTARGDYATDELAAIMDRATITGDAVDHYRRLVAPAPAIVFGVTVAHAQHVAAQFTAAGYRAAAVDGAMDKAERRARVRGLADGSIQVLASCDLISEGFDVPAVQAAILLRPTKSRGLYIQQIGRALRPKSDGSTALILDHVGNSSRFGLPDTPIAWSLDGRNKKDKAPGVTTCKKCRQVFAQNATPRQSGSCPQAIEACPFLAERAADEIAAREAPAFVGGQLEEVAFQPPWAGGLDIRKAKLGELLRHARTLPQLQEIGRARGYKAAWAWKQWSEFRNPQPVRRSA